MKVLVVDDNEALREVVKDALAAEGHKVRTSGDVEDAAEQCRGFKPDVVVLDTDVGGDDGLRVLTLLREEDPPLEFAVVLTTAPGEKVPGDDQRIRDSVEKPYRVSRIAEAVRAVQTSAAAEQAEEVAEKAARRSQDRSGRRLFGRKRNDTPPEYNLDEYGVRYGMSYVVFEPRPDEIHRFVDAFKSKGFDILVVTTDKAKAINERFNYGAVEIIQLTSGGRSGTVPVGDMGTLTRRVRRFMDERDRPVVVFDTFGEILRANGNNAPLLMLQQLRPPKGGKVCTFAVSMDEKPLSEKDKRILLKLMDKLEPRKAQE